LKNLVYYSVGKNDVYGEMLKISIESIDKSNSELTDILIITDKYFYEQILKEYQRDNLFFHIVDDLRSSDEICFNKMKIFEYENINNYENILYLDTDTLVNYNLKSLFKKCKKDNKLYEAVEDYSIENHRRIQFGFSDYTEEDIEFFRIKKIYAFNCGCFLFKNSYLMKKHFKNIWEMMNTWNKDFFADQSFINYYFNTLNLTITNKFKKDIDLVYVVQENVSYLTDFHNKIFHFLGNTYYGSSKLEMIKKFKMK